MKVKKENTLPNPWKEKYQSYYHQEIKIQATYASKKISTWFNVKD